MSDYDNRLADEARWFEAQEQANASCEERVADLERQLAERTAERDRLAKDLADSKACAEALQTIWREFQDTEGIREEHDCESYTDPRTNRCTICPLEEMVESVLSRPPRQSVAEEPMTKREVHTKTQMINVTPNPTEHPDRVAVDRGTWNNFREDRLGCDIGTRWVTSVQAVWSQSTQTDMETVCFLEDEITKRDRIISQLRKPVAPCCPSDSDRIAKLEDLLVTIRDIAYRHVGHTPDTMRRALSDITTRVDELNLSTD